MHFLTVTNFIFKKATRSQTVLQNNKHCSNKLHLICVYSVLRIGGLTSNFLPQSGLMCQQVTYPLTPEEIPYTPCKYITLIGNSNPHLQRSIYPENLLLTAKDECLETSKVVTLWFNSGLSACFSSVYWLNTSTQENLSHRVRITVKITFQNCLQLIGFTRFSYQIL